VDEQIVPMRRHLDTLLKNRADGLDDMEDESDVAGKVLSQQEKEQRSEIGRTRNA
jgi:hypothetical protein